MRQADLETLTFEVVQRGLGDSGPQEDNLHAKIVHRVERELIAQVMVECNSVQTKAATKLGYQPKHASQEAQGVRIGEVTIAIAC